MPESALSGCPYASSAPGSTDVFQQEAPDDEAPDPAGLTREALEHMAVVKLRAVARQLGLTSMTRKEIRFAKKEELLEAITAFLAERDR